MYNIPEYIYSYAESDFSYFKWIVWKLKAVASPVIEWLVIETV